MTNDLDSHRRRKMPFITWFLLTIRQNHFCYLWVVKISLDLENVFNKVRIMGLYELLTTRKSSHYKADTQFCKHRPRENLVYVIFPGTKIVIQIDTFPYLLFNPGIKPKSWANGLLPLQIFLLVCLFGCPANNTKWYSLLKMPSLPIPISVLSVLVLSLPLSCICW